MEEKKNYNNKKRRNTSRGFGGGGQKKHPQQKREAEEKSVALPEQQKRRKEAGAAGKAAGGAAGNAAGGAKKHAKKPNRGGRQGAGARGFGRERDTFDDIKSYGGRYIKTPDYDDADTFLQDTEESFGEKGAAAEETGVIAGRNAVRELLRSERSVDKLFVKSGTREGSLVVIVSEAVARGIPVIEASAEKLDVLSGGINHQGVVAMASAKQYTDVDGILAIARERGETPLVVIADCIEDPGNLGALIRCAECAGAHGIIIPKRRSAAVTPAAAKASAGAIEHMAVAKVSGLTHTVELLKKRGLWIFAAEADGTPYYEADFKVPAAVIFGSEGAGVSRTLKEKCDFVVSIPMYGKVNSLNVSAAASVILCHAARMQRAK